MITKRYAITYKAGGYPGPTYTGLLITLVNMEDDEDMPRELAAYKARKEMKRDWAYGLPLEITRVEEMEL